MVWNYNLYPVGADQDSRMQSAIRAPYPVRERRHDGQVRGPLGRRTSVHIPQIGEGRTEND